MQKEQLWLGAATEKLERVAARVRDNIPYQSYEGRWRFTNRTAEGEEPLWSRGTELVHTEGLHWWTNGFWGGLLWLLYDQTGNEAYRQYAEGLERRLDPIIEGFEQLSHDMGFMWMLTSGANYRRTGSPASLLRLKKTASHLAGRFNPAGNFLRAWLQEGREGWAIIDCMMNLSLLYYVSELVKDPRFANVARAHADMALREFQRPDGGCYHIVTFDPVTGRRTGQQTGQGYSEHSAWSRGNGWAIYGFAISAKYTGEAKYLEASARTAKFFMEHLPADGVPRADLLAPLDDPECDIDSSAAAIAAAGMLLLGRLSGEQRWREEAVRLLEALQSTCVAGPEEEALLLHGNVAFHRPLSKDIPLIYGDYFYYEALQQLAGRSSLF